MMDVSSFRRISRLTPQARGRAADDFWYSSMRRLPCPWLAASDFWYPGMRRPPCPRLPAPRYLPTQQQA